MDGEEHDNLRGLPPDAAFNHRIHRPADLAVGVHRGVLPRGVRSVAVPGGDVAPDRRPDGGDAVRVRGGERRRR